MNFLMYPFMIKAFIGSVLVGVSLSLLGIIVVMRKMSFFGSGLPHIAFAGIGLSLLLSIDPFLPTWGIVVITALILGYFNRKGYNEDMMMGIMFSVSMAVGIFLSSFSQNYSGPIIGYLFGDVLSITNTDLVYSSLFAILTIIFMALKKEELIYMSYDEEFSKVAGIKTDRLYYIFLVLLSSTIVLAVKAVGIILVSSFIILPVAIALIVVHNYKSLFIIAPIISTLSIIAGLMISFYYNLPGGSTIIILLGATFFILSLLKLERKNG